MLPQIEQIPLLPPKKSHDNVIHLFVYVVCVWDKALNFIFQTSLRNHISLIFFDCYGLPCSIYLQHKCPQMLCLCQPQVQWKTDYFNQTSSLNAVLLSVHKTCWLRMYIQFLFKAYFSEFVFWISILKHGLFC